MIPPSPLRLTIEHMGGMGDGVAYHEGTPVFIPFTCTEDEVLATITESKKDRLKAHMISLLTPSSHRQTPPCTHFGICGGCALQHMNPESYAAFKLQHMQHMVKELCLNGSVIQPLVMVGKESRRRAEFKVSVHKHAVKLGFMEEKSHAVVDLEHCHVVEPAIMRALPLLKQQITLMKKPAQVISVHLTALNAGTDMLLHLRTNPSISEKEAWQCFAATHSIIRLAVQRENDHPFILYDSNCATISHAGTEVAYPVGAFLQASRAGEAAIIHCVVDALRHCTHVVDLYAGCGTYTLHLAQHVERITALEGDQEMVSALHNAIHAAGLDQRLHTQMRDLFASPLRASELAAYDGVVINPPRNGALPQMHEIARSGVATVVMVSCNPATFQRDALVLLRAGYRITSLTPIDQFTWSRHLELVASFTKENGALCE
jgi:23S rRNA (uracil1939-C5)-methyltransferase